MIKTLSFALAILLLSACDSSQDTNDNSSSSFSSASSIDTTTQENENTQNNTVSSSVNTQASSSSVADNTIVVVEPIADTPALPIANVGSSKVINAKVDYRLVLDASGSTDSSGHTLTYDWKITSQPVGSRTTLSQNTSKTPMLIPDLEGEYLISLVVNNTLEDSKADTLSIISTN